MEMRIYKMVSIQMLPAIECQQMAHPLRIIKAMNNYFLMCLNILLYF